MDKSIIFIVLKSQSYLQECCLFVHQGAVQIKLDTWYVLELHCCQSAVLLVSLSYSYTGECELCLIFNNFFLSVCLLSFYAFFLFLLSWFPNVALSITCSGWTKNPQKETNQWFNCASFVLWWLKLWGQKNQEHVKKCPLSKNNAVRIWFLFFIWFWKKSFNKTRDLMSQIIQSTCHIFYNTWIKAAIPKVVVRYLTTRDKLHLTAVTKCF